MYCIAILSLCYLCGLSHKLATLTLYYLCRKSTKSILSSPNLRLSEITGLLLRNQCGHDVDELFENQFPFVALGGWIVSVRFLCLDW